MKTITAILLCAIFFAGCEKEETTPPPQPEPCETNNWGTVCFENTGTKPIEARINGDFLFTVDPGETQCKVELQAGLQHYYWTTDNTAYSSGYVTPMQCNTVTIVVDF